MTHKLLPLIDVLLCSAFPRFPLDNCSLPVGLLSKRVFHNLKFCGVGEWVGRCECFWLLSNSSIGREGSKRRMGYGYRRCRVLVVIIVIFIIMIISTIARGPLWPGNRQRYRSIFAKWPMTAYTHFVNKKCSVKRQMVACTYVDRSTVKWF